MACRTGVGRSSLDGGEKHPQPLVQELVLLLPTGWYTTGHQCSLAIQTLPNALSHEGELCHQNEFCDKTRNQERTHHFTTDDELRMIC